MMKDVTEVHPLFQLLRSAEGTAATSSSSSQVEEVL
jgi:hypothetical protein